MRTWLINQWDSFRTGFWFIPAILISAAVMLAIVMPEIDRWLAEATPDWVRTTGSTARSTLAALASAMFTVAGVIFSVTVVVLSLTSSQFGPRLLRSFLEESITKVTMGASLASSMYCLILLWRIDDVDGDWFVPHLSVALATLMTLAALCTVVYFIHRVAHSVQSMNVVTEVAEDLDATIRHLFPEKLAAGQSDGDSLERLSQRFDREASTSIYANHDGYLQAVNGEVLISHAKHHDLLIELRCRPGDFLIAGHEIARCLPADRCDESVAKSISKAFLTGNRRTPRQDVECAVNELVEVAVRALSPGINDPFTAVASVDRLCATVCRLAELDPAAPVRVAGDDDDQPRVIAVPTEFASVLNASFDQIRQYGSSSVSVSIRLLESLRKIGIACIRDVDRQAVERQAELVLEGCRNETLTSGDMADIQQRFDDVMAACDGLAPGRPAVRDRNESYAHRN